MFLYKYFDRKEYAEDFMNSKFRVLHLPEYQKIENPTRRDAKDGITTTSSWIDRNKVSVNPLQTVFEKPVGMLEDAIFNISEGNAISWEWHALCLSLQCNKVIAKRFNSKYIVGFNIEDLIAILNNLIYWKKISSYILDPIFYCDQKDFINNHFKNYFKQKSGDINGYGLVLFRDCFVKNMDFYDEHEFRVLIKVTGNDDPENPKNEPFFFLNERKMESATLIELN